MKGKSMVGRPEGGFGMVELLAVMTIITVLAGALGLAAISAGGGSIHAAERLAGAQFHVARNRALLKNARVRVIVNADPTDPERYLREMGLLHEVAGEEGGPLWVASDEGKRLPRGFYFHPTRSPGDGGHALPQMSIAFPAARPQREGDGSLYYYYEYNQFGRMPVTGGQFLIEPGKLEARGSAYAVVPAGVKAEKSVRGGLLLFRSGGIHYFSESNQ